MQSSPSEKNEYLWMTEEGFCEDHAALSPDQELEEEAHAGELEFDAMWDAEEAVIWVALDDYGFCRLCEADEPIEHVHFTPNPDGSAEAAERNG